MLEGLKKPEPKVVMGIDCSSNSLAFSVFNERQLVRYGEIEFGKGDIFERIGRANVLMNAIGDFIADDVEVIYFEGAAYINNKSTVIGLSYALGSAMAPLIKRGVRVESVPAMVWQRAIGNPPFTKAEKAALAKANPDRKKSWLDNEMRKQRKQKTIEWVFEKYRVRLLSDNIADAVGIGAYGAYGAGGDLNGS